MLFGAALALLGPSVPPVEPVRPATVELVWEAPEGCPDAEVMRQRIAELVVDPAGEGALKVDGRVEAESQGFRLTLRTAYGELADERTVEDRDCDALAEAAALFVVVSIDPSSTPEPEPVPAPAAQTPAEPEPAPVAAPEPTPSAASEVRTTTPPPPEEEGALRPFAVFVALGPQLEYGALPGVSGGPRLSLGLRWQRVSLAAYGFYGAPRRSDPVADVSGLAQLGAGGIRGCWLLRSTVEVPVCGAVEGGAMRVASRGPVPPNTLRYPWSAAGARTGVQRRWGRIGVFAAGEVMVPLNRSRVSVGETVAFDTWAVSLRAVLGLQIFFATESA